MDISINSLDISAEEEITSAKRYNCHDCDYHTSNKSNLNKHVKRMHPKQPSTSTPSKPETSAVSQSYICDSCGKMFKSHFGLDLHVKNKHTKEFKYVCDVCTKGYNQRVQFRFHVASHSSVGLDKCKFCRMEFQSNGSLKRHLETCQLTTMPFVCDICQASFPRKYKLDEHHRGKHGERRYLCTLCGKRFGWRSSLKAHSKCCQKS